LATSSGWGQTPVVDDLGDLFGKSAYLAWLPGETLFSLISRHHFFWGHPFSSRTCAQFFGHRRAGSQHDFPSRLSKFDELTRGRYGTVDQIARHHTLLAYYASFMNELGIRNAIATMSGDSVNHLKYRLGILTSRFRANHPLKSCPACMQNDRAEYGWTYWHMDHQYPGVWICPKHGELLRESLLKATGVERFLWHLPSEDQFRTVSTEYRAAIQHVHPALLSLSRLVHELVTPGLGRTIDASRLYELYKSEVSQRGWVTQGGNYRMPEIASSYFEYAKRFRILPELTALPSTLSESVTQLGRLLRPPRSGTHPLRHLVLIHWLFGTAEAFLSSYAALLSEPLIVPNTDAVTMGDGELEQTDTRQAQLLNLISTQRYSMRKAAKVVGVDVGTAITWAAKAGVTVPRRPKKMTAEIRGKAISALQKGHDKVVVAKNANVSVVTITKLLLSEVGLHAVWRRSRDQLSQANARQKWVLALQLHANLGIKYIRTLEPAVYAWLYRNDRAWLDEHKPERLVNTIKPEVRRLLWDARDEKLSVSVEQAALVIQKENSGRRIKLWQLFQAVPDLKSKLSSLNQLPLTRRAIDLALLRVDNITQPDLFG
jgi:Tn7-like transposition protein D/TniQ